MPKRPNAAGIGLQPRPEDVGLDKVGKLQRREVPALAVPAGVQRHHAVPFLVRLQKIGDDDVGQAAAVERPDQRAADEAGAAGDEDAPLAGSAHARFLTADCTDRTEIPIVAPSGIAVDQSPGQFLRAGLGGEDGFLDGVAEAAGGHALQAGEGGAVRGGDLVAQRLGFGPGFREQAGGAEHRRLGQLRGHVARQAGGHAAFAQGGDEFKRKAGPLPLRAVTASRCFSSSSIAWPQRAEHGVDQAAVGGAQAAGGRTSR